MENKFKVGDLVRFRNEEQRKVRFNQQEYVIHQLGHTNEYVRVYNDEGTLCDLYADRFELVPKKEMSVIKEGVHVQALADVGVSLVKGEVYRVEAYDGSLVKLYGVRNRIRNKFFKVVEAPAIIQDNGEKLLKELAEKVGGNPGTCSYVLEFACGHKEWHIRDACHARLNNYMNKEKRVKAVALNVSGHRKHVVDKEAYEAHVQYITQESPFKECFLPRPLNKIMKDGVLLNLDKPYSRVVAAAIALRSGSEFTIHNRLFKKVVDLGFSGNVAVILSTFFTEKPNGLVFNNWGGGHHYMCSTMKMEELVKFFNEGFHKDLKEKAYKDTSDTAYTIFASIADEDRLDRGTFNSFAKEMKGVALNEVPGYWQKVPMITGKNAIVKCAAALCKYF